MRAFIAIEITQEIKDAIGRVQAKLKATGADVKWVSPSNIHLTLKFLGEIDEKTMDAVTEVMREVASGIGQFRVKLGSIGAFPHIQSPRVIWIGLAKGHDQAKTIARNLENGLETCGLEKENREFSSHITIGRIRSLKNKDALTACMSNLEGSALENLGEFQAGKITLFKSTLTPKGPIYEKLQETNLKTA